MAMDKVQVAVRVRPVNRREIELSTKCVIGMEGNQTVLYHPKDSPLDASGQLSGSSGDTDRGRRKAPKSFAFDHCFWSMDKDNPKFAGQQVVFTDLGESVLEQAFQGYNGCIFAYGQTGSGKSYTMMGTTEEKGIIPRLCDVLFERIAKLETDTTNFKVEVSYMEIYNEKVHDLLDLKGHKQNLKVREHNILGPYVDGLSTLVVTSFEDINNLMSEGNKSRTVAATNMNNESSRSHAVFNIIVTQTLVDLKTSASGEKVSKLSLVDLAGSERAQKTGAMGDRLREGSNINKSLTTLGLVISALADQGGAKGKNKFVPYRDSVLTWLLKDNLGGNSKTVMIATISPSADNYEETLSTLRYADRAKRIVNHAVVNEDPNARIIRELREEVDILHKELKEAQSMKAPDLKDKLEESEKLLREMRKTWEEKLAETEKIQTERHKALEEMGVSVETSGIKVQHSRYFLVNLNADPSLNELLVYYLKERTLVGCPNEETKPDIQLSGLGIQPEHCIVNIEDSDVIVSPVDGARTCVNGSVIHQKTKVKHGDRILWGNNHFFRINCPIQNSPCTNSPDADQTIDYNFAQQELMMKEFSNDPISEAISAVEKQYEEDKQEALEKQRQMYERQMQMLRYQLMSPGTPSMPFPPVDMSKLTPSGVQSGIQRKYQQWALERDKMFKQSLCKLREEVVKANSLVREANFLAEEMGKQTEFHVTLQIPASNLSPNRRRGAFVCEPAILVRRKQRGSQVWSMEKFENKIIDMRDMYEDRKAQGIPLMVDDSDESESDDGPPQKGDPFYESYENHNLIGVANVFLDCLFYDVKLDYHVPVISQQGEVAGKLHVEISKLGGAIMDRYADIHCDGDSDDESSLPVGTPLIIRVKIREAKGLPKDLSNFVFCQYSFWGHDDPISVPPEINPDAESKRDTKCVRFGHERDFKVFMSEEFIEHAQEGALSIEVWGHKVVGFGTQMSNDSLARSNSLMDRWLEVTRKIELCVEIHEVNDQGEYAPVEVKPQPEVPSAGVFQLRQGHARRIMTRVKAQADSGTLPLICDSITSLTIGCICARSKLQKGLDSYQEEDLNRLRERWSDALTRRHTYLDSQIQKLINKQDKTESDCDRERALIDQWVSLTEERNAVLVPAAGSGIPGAPADWECPAGMEQHRPVLFLELNSDDMTTPSAKEGTQAAGINSILPKEQSANYVGLPILKTYTEKENVCAITSWDSSIHDSPHLNRITSANDRVYLILKVVLRLSHPAYMELVLRKRVCVNVKHRNMSITDKLKKRWIGTDGLHSSAITYDVVSNIPKASEDLEDMETLAQMAASQNEVSAADGETYIEKYIKGVSAVESILTLDRLRQEVAVKELMAVQGRSLRKTTSVPNIHQFVTTPPKLDERMRFDSIQDLSFQGNQSSAAVSAPGECPSVRKRAFSLVGLDIATIAKELSFKLGIARPSFLDLRVPSLNVTPKSALSPLGGKLSMKPLQTLQEERHAAGREHKPLLDSDEEDDDSPLRPYSSSFSQSKSSPSNLNQSELSTSRSSLEISTSKQELLDNKQDLITLKEDLKKLKKKLSEPDINSPESDDFQDFESYESQQVVKQSDVDSHSEVVKRPVISHSGTCDSIVESQYKSNTPSMTSSGYGSQAVSTLTLSSEDSLSLRSNDDSESHRAARKAGLEHASSGESIGDEQNQSHSSAINEEEGFDINDVDCEAGIAAKCSQLEDCSSSETLENMVIDPTGEKTEKMEKEVVKDVDSLMVESVADSDEDVDAENGGSGDSAKPMSLHISESDLESLDVEQEKNDVVNDNETNEGNGCVSLKLNNKTDSNTEAEVSKVEMDETAADVNDDESGVARTSHSADSDKLLEDSESEKLGHSGSLCLDKKSKGSSSASSRGPLHSDSIDPYSMEAMEELERLGEEYGNDNSEFTGISGLSIDDQSLGNTSEVAKLNKSGVRGGTIEQDSGNVSNASMELDESLSKCDLKPEFESTPKRREGGGSGARQRPVSCIVSSQSQNELMDMSLKDRSKRNSLDFSEGNLSEDGMSVCSFGSRADLDRISEVPVPSWIQVGESVMVTSSKSSLKMTGVVQFVGSVEFASGPWVGVDLDLPEGKNDGSVNGIRYFRCRSRHGIFVRHDKLIWDKKRKGSRKSAANVRKSLHGTGSGSSAKGSSASSRKK